MAEETSAVYERFVERLRRLRHLQSAGHLLGWDQETYMPPKAAARRADQLAVLEGLAHEQLVSDELGGLLAELGEEAAALDEGQRANVREIRRVYDRARKLPQAFVEELARTCSHAHEAWIQARKASEWSAFAPHLQRIIELKREEAERVGYEAEAYDALLDEFEPGARAAAVAPVLGALRDKLVPLAQAIAERPRPSAIEGPFPRERQERFARQLCAALGFDLEAGRLDVSTHPFCSGLEPNDVRLTTRYDEGDIRQALFGVVHEAGHGLYEQGLASEHFGTPLGEPASTAIHESQSRLWENIVARSRPFWEHYFPALQELFPDALAGVDAERWHRWVNEVKSSPIRVEADEVTYNLHILLRFEIERELFRGALAIDELPGVWNEKMESYLGIRPKDDAEGVLQDIHWSFGGFGYFPTYTLGTLYAAQLFDKAAEALPGLWEQVGRGELAPLREWLRREVHARGMLHPPDRLIEVVTGAPLSPEHFTRYLTDKYTAVYGL